MDAKKYLEDYAPRADKYLDEFFGKKISEVSDIGKGGKGTLVAVDMLSRYRKFSKGGKKLRGALVQLGYEIGGGNKKDVLEASTSIEIIHSFLLMHDDIQDLDSLRRGSLTIHKQFEEEYKSFKAGSDPSHYGISMGINTGDLGAYLGTEVLLTAKIDELNKVRAGVYLSRLLQHVAYGQGLDVTYEQMKGIQEHDVMQVHLHKTGIYTIPGPLKIGAMLAGVDDKRLGAIDNFGEPVGIAFQLRDDELGLFSDQGTLGKPVGGDIREGKNTILKVKAVELAKGEDRRFLVWAYGNKNIGKKDVEKVKQITRKVGALDYSQDLSKNLVNQGKKYIGEITDNSRLQGLLMSFADFVVARDN